MKRNILFTLIVFSLVLTACGGIFGTPAPTGSTPTAGATGSNACVSTTEDAANGIAFDPLAPGGSTTATDKNGASYSIVCNSSGDGKYVKTVLSTPAPTNAPAATSTNVPATSDKVEAAINMALYPPFETKVQQDENGRNVTTLAGFDLAEFGGNDSGCTRTELESIHIGEVVSSQSEKCLTIIEWSLKFDDTTVLAGTYALQPGEWFYVPLAVSGINDSPRIVGTMWYLPRGWNSHMYAADIAEVRDIRDGTISYVGLSPTDPWVVAIAESLK